MRKVFFVLGGIAGVQVKVGGRGRIYGSGKRKGSFAEVE